MPEKDNSNCGVKGNSKGSIRSFTFRRTLIISSIVMLATVLFVILVASTNTSSTNNLLLRAKRSFGANAAEVEVTANGDTPSAGENQIRKEEELDQEAETSDIDGSSDKIDHTLPHLTYGTAWKKERTAELVNQAVLSGFRHIDTACQPRHYNEKGVGEGWTSAAKSLGLKREDIWIQTKYSSISGQDHDGPNKAPYDMAAPLEEQVKKSLEISLKNLQTSYLDSWVMHSPERTWEKTLLAWKTMESFVESGKVKQIGMSNIYDFDAVKYLYEQARIKPKVIQNRFYKDSNYDVDIRKFCLDHDIEYQSFWTLGANRHALHNKDVVNLAVRKGLSPECLLYAFCIDVGITPLDGTTNEDHMKEDVELIRRIQSGEEKIFTTHDELSIVARALNLPGWFS